MENLKIQTQLVDDPTIFTYAFKLRMFTDHTQYNKPDKFMEFIEERFGTLYQWTFGNETSLKSNRPHWHLHLITRTEKERKITKTPITQLFKTWYKQKYPGLNDLPKNQYSIKFEKELRSHEEFLMYPLKCQETIEPNKNYYHVENVKELHAQAKILMKKKKEYIDKKLLKEETINNVWNQLCNFLTEKSSEDPRWIHLILTEQEAPSDSENYEYLGKIRNIRMAFNILGPYIVDYYRTNHNSDIPWNIDKMIIKYLCQKNLVLSRDIYFILSR